jgi:hypothetical protein
MCSVQRGDGIYPEEPSLSHVSNKIAIQKSTAVVWRLVSDFDKAPLYLENVIHCKTTGQNIGAKRALTSVDGSIIVERLDTLDMVAHRLSYTLLTNTPFRHCVTNIAVRSVGIGESELEWSVTFEADGIPASEAIALQKSALAANCLTLKLFLEANQA